MSSPAATSAFGLGGYASPSQCSRCNHTFNETPPLSRDSRVSKAMIQAEGVRRGVVAQHDERRRKTMRATRFRRAALFAERLGGTGKKVKGREIDVAPWFCTGPCAGKAANHWQATAPRRAPVAPRPPHISSSDRPDRVLFNSHFDGFLSRKAFDLRSRSLRSILDLSRFTS